MRCPRLCRVARWSAPSPPARRWIAPSTSGTCGPGSAASPAGTPRAPRVSQHGGPCGLGELGELGCTGMGWAFGGIVMGFGGREHHPRAWGGRWAGCPHPCGCPCPHPGVCPPPGCFVDDNGVEFPVGQIWSPGDPCELCICQVNENLLCFTPPTRPRPHPLHPWACGAWGDQLWEGKRFRHRSQVPLRLPPASNVLPLPLLQPGSRDTQPFPWDTRLLVAVVPGSSPAPWAFAPSIWGLNPSVWGLSLPARAQGPCHVPLPPCRLMAR